VEFRRRLGHRSSYGLLAARPPRLKAEPAASFEPTPNEAGAIGPPVCGDQVVLSPADLSWAVAVQDTASRIGMLVTAATCGSSAPVFRRLAIVPAALLDADLAWAGCCGPTGRA
jgi:hypothetical protein